MVVKIGLVVLGFATGLAIWFGPRYADVYAAKGLPLPYQGPRVRYWDHGEEIT